MRVALLTDSAAFAGTERHMLDLVRALRAAGVEAELACPANGDLAKMARAENLPVCDVAGAGLSTVPLLRANLRSRRWDLIHAHNGRTAFMAALACLAARRGRLVATQHFIDPARTLRRGWRSRLAKLAHGWVEGRTSYIIAISEAVKRALLLRDGTSPAKVPVVINGLHDPALDPHASTEEVRAALQIPAGAPLIVCVCRLEPEKSVETLVHAMAEVSQAVPAAICVIGGAGSEETRLAGEIARLGLERSVRLLGFQKDPYPLMRAADVFVLPSRAEPFGLALVEAMALHCPVVATRAGGPLEIVVEGESGLLVPPEEPAALAAALVRLIHDAPLRARLGAGARRRFETNFTVARMGREIATVYAAALANATSAAE